jgi:hypothetical protein
MFQELRQGGSQRHWAYRLVHQMVTERANLAQWLRSCISTYEKGWYGHPKAAAYRFNCRDARFSVGETIVGNNQIGRLATGAEREQGLAI